MSWWKRLVGGGSKDEVEDAGLQTGATFDAPLWLYGTKSSETWLLPREPGRKLVVVVDFSDPYEHTEEKTRGWLVDSAAFLLSEALWMRTDAPASSTVLVNLALKKIIQPTGGLAKYEDLSGLTSTLTESTVVTWGVAGRDIEQDGITMKVRLTDEATERSFTAPYDDLVETLITWLVGRGFCARRDPPAWFALPKDRAKLPLYAILFHNLQMQLLADAKNHALPPLDADFHDDMVDYALDGVSELEAGEQTVLATIASAVYAKRAGALREERRRAVLDLVGKIIHEDLRRLVPRFYATLGEPERARAAEETIGSSAYRSTTLDAQYRAWLTKIHEP